MAGSASQQTIANFVSGNTTDLPSWAAPDPGSAAALPSWARKNAPAKKPSALATPGGGPIPATPQPSAADIKAQAAAQRQAAKTQAAQQKSAHQSAKAQAQANAKAQQAAAKQSSAFAQASANAGIGLGNAASNLADSVSSIGTGIASWASSWPTPGGIGLLLIVIFILLWALIPVDDQGYTRMQLLWFTVMGRTELQGSTTQQNAETVAELATATSPLLGVTSLAQNVQGTIQDFSVSPASTGTVNPPVYNM
jgi:multidrug efflux pump subunit AcrA (membrane-fusion protein)